MLRMKKRFRLSSQYRVRRFIGAGYALSGRSVKFYEVRAYSGPNRQSRREYRGHWGLPLRLEYQISKISQIQVSFCLERYAGLAHIDGDSFIISVPHLRRG